MIVEKYYATWCGPCQTLNPIFEDLEEDFPEVEFQHIDIDDEEDKTNDNNVRSVPTVIVKSDEGEELHRLVGTASKQRYAKIIKNNF